MPVDVFTISGPTFTTHSGGTSSIEPTSRTMKVVLAEKPSVARELASFLGAGSRHEGYFEGRGYQVTWALGHLVTLKEPQDYDPALKRCSLDTLPFVPERFGLKPLDEKGSGKQLTVVRRLFRSADELICATDAGREGELIFRYILKLTGCEGKPARRLWLSSLTREAIRDAFGRLRPLSDYDALYVAAHCRSEADWVVGLNATRSHTVSHRDTGLLWSVGRVQTPVLAMIVRRDDDEIRAFKPEPFWELLTCYRSVVFKFTGDRFRRGGTGPGAVAPRARPASLHPGVDRKPERTPPPQLYDLTDLQRDMNRRYGLSADATLKAAQLLYEAKLISYPRTDSRHVGTDMKAKISGILEDLRPLKPLEIGKLDLHALAFTKRIVDDAKVGDHHAILPIVKAPGTLSPAAQKVFDAVVTRLIAALYPACKTAADLFMLSISTGMISKLERRSAAALEAPYQELAIAVHQAKATNIDETSWREKLRTVWLWATVTPLFTVFTIAKNRGGEVAKALLGSRDDQVVGSDRFSAYAWIMARW
jgi:DNA topoisomerase III